MQAEAINVDMVKHSNATNLARAWEKHSKRIRELIIELAGESRALDEAFASESMSSDHPFQVSVAVNHHRDNRPASEESAEDIVGELELTAWRVLIAKLGIKKIMSAKRAAELSEALNEYRQHRHRNHWEEDKKKVRLPPITEETILGVIGGFAASVDEFLEEAIVEEYDHWKPGRRWADYKRNSDFKLNKKIIVQNMVEPGWGGMEYRPNYRNEQHFRALDQIFHLLDGKGTLPGYDSPFVEAVKSTVGGVGESSYFKFKLYGNGNIHLEFKRVDLLDKFNEVAGRNRLPDPNRN